MNYKTITTLMGIMGFFILSVSMININTKESKNVDKSYASHFLFVESGGTMYTKNHYKNEPMQLNGDKFIGDTKSDFYFDVGLSAVDLPDSPVGLDLGLEYRNINGTAHVGALFGNLTFTPNWYDGYFFIGGAFGYGVDKQSGVTFYSSDGSNTYQFKSTDNPKFVYTRFSLGTNYPITEHLGLTLQLQSIGRDYDLKVTSSDLSGSTNPGFVIDALSAQNVSMTVLNWGAQMGIQYRF